MLIGAIVLGFFLGFSSNLGQLKYINALLTKTQFDIERQKNKQHLESEAPIKPQITEKSSDEELIKMDNFQQDDLKKLLGINKLIEKKLNNFGIYTFRQLQLFNPLNLKHQLTAKKELMEVSDIIIWQQQAALAAANRWDELNNLQEELNKSKKN